MRLMASHGQGAQQRRRRDRSRAAPLLLVAALALTGCTGGTAVESAAPAPSPAWDPIMAAPGTEPLPEATGETLQSVLEDLLAQTELPGATAAVVSPDGVWQGASGTDGAGVELVPDSAMALMSITKTFTAAAVMGLVEDGRVALDAPIDSYVDLPFETDGATVRQVLNMRSGFPADRWREPASLAAISADLDRAWTSEEILGVYEGAMDGAGELGGEQFYSNLNSWALQALVEEVTGDPMAEVVRSRFADPAGLDRAWWQDAEEPEPPLTVAEELAGITTVDADGPWLPSRSWATADGPAAGMAAAAADVARWGYLLYGGYLLRPETVAQMTESGQPEGYPCLDYEEFTCYYGLHTWLFDDVSHGHSGGGPSYHTIMRVWPEDDISVSVLVPAPLESAKYGSPWIGDLAAGFRDAVRGS